MCIKHDIHKFILAESKPLLPLSYRYNPQKPDESKSYTKESSELDSIMPEHLRSTHQLLGYKVLADVIEALIGVYFEGFKLAGA